MHKERTVSAVVVPDCEKNNAQSHIKRHASTGLHNSFCPDLFRVYDIHASAEQRSHQE